MIKFENVSKSFKGNKVVKDISFEINQGELVVLIGPSGCGKTTTLKMINRLVNITKGKIYVNGEDVMKMDPLKLRRNIGYVIQQTGLFPHMTVRENIEIISKIQGQSEEQIKNRTIELMNMVGLEPNEFLDRYPNQLSGGQQQRIGVARAFACDPDIVLMDEPFSALDPLTRVQLQEELVMLQKELKKTVVFVTHDMDEAVKIADKICIMSGGYIVQYDKTEVILKNPKDEYVSDFVGKNRIWSMPEFIKGEDIMITNPVTSIGAMSVQSCLSKMKEKKVDSVLIVDNKNILIGIFTFKMAVNIKDKSVQVRDVCKKDHLSVNPENSIIEIMKVFYDENVNNIPVIDSENHLCGLITSGSLAATLSEQYIEMDYSDIENSEDIIVKEKEKENAESIKEGDR